jgi:hypothetical protein
MRPSVILFDTAMAKNETIELTTDGGLTGRGIGSVRIEGTKLIVSGRFVRNLSATEVRTLVELTSSLEDFEGSRQTPDAVHYRLRAGGHTLTWTDADPLPRPAQALFDALWNLL